jgi:hypothetical protein
VTFGIAGGHIPTTVDMTGLLTDRKIHPRKVIDANHPGLRIMGWFMSIEGILLAIAAVVMYLYKHFR